MKKYIFLLVLLLLSATSEMLRAQDVLKVTGTVTDETNATIAGVSIAVKDRVTGTITNENGQYNLKAEPNSTLIFSHVGYRTQEVKIGTRELVNIVMIASDSSVLNEVVVTAAGAQRKATVVGAITTVDVDQLRTPTSNITNALQGNVAGIIGMQLSGEPGNNQSEFWIRGISTFGASQSALVLVDGFERPFNEINIEDIQSFSVLKDASATALYGSKGANGAILITTKKGKTGKINIEGKAEYGYSTRTRTPEFVDGYTYAKLVNEAKITRNQEPLYSETELELFREGLDPDLYPNVDWQKKMLRNGANRYRASINLGGGATIARYFVSASYVDEGGMYKSDNSLKDYKTNAHMNRWNYRVNYDMDITKSTTLALGIAGFLEKQNFPGLNDQNIWFSLLGQNPVSIPFMYSNGLVPAYGTGNRTNPWVLATQTGYREYWQNKMETNVILNQRLDMLTQGLRATARIAFDADSKNNINRKKWPEQYSVERRRDRNGNLIMHRVSTESLMFQESYSEGERVYQGELELNYGRNFANKHNVEALIKTFAREVRMTQNVGTDIKNGIPHRNLSYSGRAMYGYRNRYLAEFNFGYTGSENFRKGHQFGFFPAIAVGWNVAEEKFIKDNIGWLDLFKIRYSIGEVGNDYFGNNRFAYLSSIDYRRNDKNELIHHFNFGEPGNPNTYAPLGYTQVASDALTWEIARKQNLGLDVNILQNMLSFTIDIFQETRSNIYMIRGQLPLVLGIPERWVDPQGAPGGYWERILPWANVGKMDNRGFDGRIEFNKRLGEVGLTLRSNITYYKNQVLARDEQENYYPYLMQEGFRAEQSRGLIALGLFKDYEEIRNSPRQTFGAYMPGDIKYKDVNGDGVINGDDVVPIGASHRPAVEYGMGMSVSWKGLDVNLLFQGAGRSTYFLNGPTVYPFIEGGWGNILTEVTSPGSRWISRDISGDPATENPNAKYPRLSYGGSPNNYRASTFWMRDGSYLRFKTLEMGYSVPTRIVNKLGLSSSRIYLLAYNLLVWDKVKVWDPEMASSDGTRYPLPRTLTVGLNFKF
ncbi:SusC/RagA family TonB-linked outer membrane protein [Haoranjiania flava]|uniref:TonB-dependent receptor n=1 Tax=Haoranjiania flava TaxID=1856322 RepID=A0AAE3IN68_9BACT|nr:TonB-dependent receptor [Haoranjiania flava]MCU7694160.1 TonB-dependent receptor [Haoranjiania flava]